MLPSYEWITAEWFPYLVTPTLNRLWAQLGYNHVLDLWKHSTHCWIYMMADDEANSLVGCTHLVLQREVIWHQMCGTGLTAEDSNLGRCPIHIHKSQLYFPPTSHEFRTNNRGGGCSQGMGSKIGMHGNCWKWIMDDPVCWNCRRWGHCHDDNQLIQRLSGLYRTGKYWRMRMILGTSNLLYRIVGSRGLLKRVMEMEWLEVGGTGCDSWADPIAIWGSSDWKMYRRVHDSRGSVCQKTRKSIVTLLQCLWCFRLLQHT